MGIFTPFLLVMFSLFVVCCDGYTFYVGGRDGWVLHPAESYSDWAGRNRFQVNDTLVFKYEKGEDSVLEVSQQDFDRCNLSNPIQKMDAGDSVFKFDRSGPFFFVSGTGDRCKQGQKLIVVVLAVRPKSPIVQPTPPSMSPSTPPVLSPALVPAFSPGPNSPFVQPPVAPPVSSPTITPIMSPTESPAPTPLSMPPPTNSPVTSPPGVSPAPSPFTISPPVSSPTISPALSPSTQPSAPGTSPTPPSPSGSPTQPSPPGTPISATPPSTGTPNNPTGSSPGSSDSRVSSMMLAVAVLIVNYGIFN